MALLARLGFDPRFALALLLRVRPSIATPAAAYLSIHVCDMELSSQTPRTQNGDGHGGR